MLEHRTETTEEKPEFDSCVKCGEPTNVRRDTPVEKRPDYIPGAGQACGDCYLEVWSSEQYRIERDARKGMISFTNDL